MLLFENYKTQHCGTVTPRFGSLSYLHRLEDIANVAALSKQERAQYDESVKVYRDYLATMDAAKTEGRQEGLEEGRQEGISRAASNMKKQGILPSIISQCTGLSEAEIEKL